MKKVNNEIKFTFADVSSREFQNEILKLNSKKANVENDIPAKILIGSNDITSTYLSDIYNTSKNHYDFPMALKMADVIPIHKTDEKNIMKNYRPVSLLPIISKLLCLNKLVPMLTISFPIIYLASGKDIVLNSA